jgi:single stranded DNA-binding protein
MSSPSLNLVVLVGSLVRDAELRPRIGGAMARMCVAMQDEYRGRDGKVFERAARVDVETWVSDEDDAARRLRRGALVAVEGVLTSEETEDADGRRRAHHLVHARRVEALGGGEAPRKSAPRRRSRAAGS